MSSQNLNIILSLQDKASKELNEFKGRVEGMQPAFKKMAVVGVAGFGAVAGAIGVSIKAFQGQERAEARLEQIARQVTGANIEQIKSFKKLAKELQAVGVVGDEVIIAGQSQIASFTKEAEVVSLLSNDLADLAVAQYGVNVSQEQAIQTGNLLGKALQGQLGALTRTGILVSEDFKEAFENANSEMERAEVISKIVADNYGGLNEAMRATSEGGVQALKNSFGDLMEVFGEAFVPMLVGAVEKIAPVIEKVAQWISENQRLVLIVTAVTAGVFALLAVVGTLGLLLPMIVLLFGLLSGTVGVVIGIIAGLAFAITNVTKIMLILQNDMELVWEGIKIIFKEAIDWIISKALDPLHVQLQRILDMLHAVSGGVGGIMGRVGGAIGGAISRKIRNVNDAVISPRGDIISTHPDDYLIATKNPQGLAGGSIVINITDNSFMGEEDMAERVGDQIMSVLQMNTKMS